MRLLMRRPFRKFPSLYLCVCVCVSQYCRHMLTTQCRYHFPPTPQDLPQSSTADESQQKPSGESPPSSEILAANLPDPPATDPSSELDGQSAAKKQKTNNSDDHGPNRGLEESFASVHGTEARSEDGWEDVDGSIERLDDDPVEVDKEPSIADVQSVRSSSVDDVHSVDNLLEKDW